MAFLAAILNAYIDCLAAGLRSAIRRGGSCVTRPPSSPSLPCSTPGKIVVVFPGCVSHRHLPPPNNPAQFPVTYVRLSSIVGLICTFFRLQDAIATDETYIIDLR